MSTTQATKKRPRDDGFYFQLKPGYGGWTNPGLAKSLPLERCPRCPAREEIKLLREAVAEVNGRLSAYKSNCVS